MFTQQDLLLYSMMDKMPTYLHVDSLVVGQAGVKLIVERIVVIAYCKNEIMLLFE